MPRPMICEACDKGDHQNCANPQACVCAFRGHNLVPIQPKAGPQ